MSDGFHKRTWCVARKPHHCDECSRRIEPGERYARHRGRWEGHMWGSKGCAHCEVFRAYSVYLLNPCEWSFGCLGDQELADPFWASTTALQHPGYVPWLRLIVGFRAQWKRGDGALWPIPELPADIPDCAT